MNSTSPLQTKKIRFTADTVVNVHHVGREHIGQVRLRSSNGDASTEGSTEYFFPAGSTIVVPDYVASGVAEEVTGDAGDSSAPLLVKNAWAKPAVPSASANAAPTLTASAVPN
jgi:hypothetical protein